MCEQTRILGVDRGGAFAGFVALPESVVWLNDRRRFPPEIAALQEPFGNAVFATSQVDLAGRTVAILGCGPIGLFSVAVACASGAGRFLASDRKPFRLAPARRLGATDALTVEETRVVAGWFHEVNEGVGVDVVFEMSGSPVRSAMRSGLLATATA
jgi:threonine 3-dehydrogenase